jgi:hypothetical protein
MEIRLLLLPSYRHRVRHIDSESSVATGHITVSPCVRVKILCHLSPVVSDTFSQYYFQSRVGSGRLYTERPEDPSGQNSGRGRAGLILLVAGQSVMVGP